MDIYRDTKSVGHIPYNLALKMSAFLVSENEAVADITGAKVNRVAGYGLEASTVYMDLTLMLTK